MRYDPILVHYLARELDGRFAGAGARALRVDARARVAALETTAGTLVLELHPARGGMTIGAAPPASVVIPLHRRTMVAGVTAPPDERLLIVELAGAPATRPRRLVVELLTNQWNLVAVDGAADDAAETAGRRRPTGRIVAVLWARDAGGRRLRVGVRYSPPPPSRRLGVDAPLAVEEWNDTLAPLPAAERARRLVARVAWTSPLNAASILGPAGVAPMPGVQPDEGARKVLEDAYARYRALTELGPARPCLLELPNERMPYPQPLAGLAARAAPTLLDALALATEMTPPAPPPAAPASGIAPELVERLRGRLRALEARVRRLDAQGAGALDEAVAIRKRADVLIANLRAVRKGMARVTLPDFAGGELSVELEPALSPSDNAARLYEEARRRQRAAARVPVLIAAVELERARVADALLRAETGQADAAELEALAGADAPGRGRGAAGAAEERLPYRRYRTSGGLEVRVGRNRRANDALTFHHSSPADIWLHARDVGGAHVVLRWGDAEGNPPRRDLAEAAVLAALHSRARTSGLVAVDWTRRKYVRKPRKAPPGVVTPERVRTIFVEPDREAEKRMQG